MEALRQLRRWAGMDDLEVVDEHVVLYSMLVSF
jgi:hypothetical protein